MIRSLKFLALCAFAVIAANSAALLGQSQLPPPATSAADARAIATAFQTLQDQQQQLTQNHAKIDALIASIAENVRVARLYSARAR